MNLPKQLQQHERLVGLCLRLGSLGCLAIAAFLATYRAGNYLSGHTDSLVYPYLLQHFRLHDLLLPGEHTNLLKFPLFWLQNLLPYTFSTFMMVTVGLTLIALALWLLLSRVIVGRQAFLIITGYLLCVILGSRIFIFAISGTTIRNIEYPIALLFMAVCGWLLTSQKLSRKGLVVSVVAAVLYTLTCAGDRFFLYTVTPAVLLAIALSYWKRPGGARNYQSIKWPLSLVVGSSLTALAVSHLLDAVGVIRPYTDPIFKPHILALSHLAPSIAFAFPQLLDMFGANIFGLDITTSNALLFFNFVILVAGTVGLVQILRHTISGKNTGTRKQGIAPFVFVAASITYFTVLVVYIVSDLVVRQTSTGAIVTSGQARYLSFMPLLLGFGLVYVLRGISRNVWKSGALLVLSLAVIALSTGVIRQNLTYDLGMKSSEIAVAQEVTSHHIKLLVSGYWYGASVRFWSHDQTDYVTVVGCDIPQPVYNNRASWYKVTSPTTKSALVIARGGLDAPYWQACTDAQLVKIYGSPAEIIQVQGENSPSLWIYNYDLRTRINPIAL